MTVCELIYQAVKRGLKVLACAGSNIAVDNIVERLGRLRLKTCRIGHPARMLPQVYESCLDARISKTEAFKYLKEQKKEVQKLLTKLRKTKEYEQRKEMKSGISAAR